MGAHAAHVYLQGKRRTVRWHSAQWTEAACQAPSDREGWRHAMRCSLHTAGGYARGLQEPFQVKAVQPHKVSIALVWRQPSLSFGAWQAALQRAPQRPCCASCLKRAPACMMQRGAGRRRACGGTHHRRAGRLLEVAWLAVVAIRRGDRGVLRCLRAHVTRLHVVRLAMIDAAAAVLEILCLREALLLRQAQNLQLSIRSVESGPGIEGT